MKRIESHVSTMLAIAVLSVIPAGAWAEGSATVVVPGTSDLWLAGMPDGSTASLDDVAPDQSPVLVPLALPDGGFLTWSASGAVHHGPGILHPPDGPAAGGVTEHTTGAENGIGHLVSPVDALIAVFLGPDQPSLTPAPAGVLDFTAAADRDFLSLSPALKQPFFMGDGLTSGLVPQEIEIPDGATRLYVGTMDGFGWYNNAGEFAAVIICHEPRNGVVPEGGSALAGLGVLALGAASWRWGRRRA